MAIDSHPTINNVHTGIRYSVYFEVVDAAIAAGAGLDELEKLGAGHYNGEFVAMLVAWHRSKGKLERHTNDAVSRSMKKGK